MNWKRFLATMLAFAMIFTMMPVVRAVDTNLTKLQDGVDGLDVAHGPKKLMNGNNAPASFGAVTWTVDWGDIVKGKKIVASAVAASMVVYGELVLTNADYLEAVLEFQCVFTPYGDQMGTADNYYCVMREGVILAASEVTDEGDTFSIKLGKGQSVVIKIVSPSGSGRACYLDINNISLAATTTENQTAIFKPATEGGSYTINDEKVTEGTEVTAPVGTEYKLVATAEDGYQFIGWKNGDTYISWSREYAYPIMDGQTIQPVFAPVTTAIFGVGNAKFDNLNEADAYASNGVIVLLNNGTLPAGEYTISAGNTLLIPYDDANTVHTTAATTAYTNETGNLWTNVPWEKPTAYRTLTMATGASITVEGAVNVGGRHSCGPRLTAGAPSGDVGMIQMLADSKITVAKGGTLYCWGYIYGGGTVTAKNGATIHENFQFSDFRGGNATLAIAQTYVVFPLTQYYVQNIEVATTLEYGAVEKVSTSIFMQEKCWAAPAIQFIGPDKENSMFAPCEGGSVTKTYIPETDRLQIVVEGDGSINPMAISLGGFNANTQTFVLPITNNMSIQINSGTTALNQSLALLPGVELTIAQGATLTLSAGEVYRDEHTGEPVMHQTGNNLIIYDRDQWFKGFAYYWDTGELGMEEDTYHVYNGTGTVRLQPIAYSPSWSDEHYVRTEDDLVDAVVDINGQLIADGFVYTTAGMDMETESLIAGGAIISSQGTGKVVMNSGAGWDYYTLLGTQQSADPALKKFIAVFLQPAQLKNANGSYFDTGTAEGTTFAYCAVCGEWGDVADVENSACPNVGEHVEISWVIDGVNIPQEVRMGAVPVYGNGVTPVKEGYVFLGWSTTVNGTVLETLPAVNGGEVFYAIFEKEAAGLKGDLNGDGNVDSDDLTLLARHVGGIELVSGQNLENADVNGDGVVNSDDLTVHARYVGGIIKEWP